MTSQRHSSQFVFCSKRRFNQVTTENPETDISPKNHTSRFIQTPSTHTQSQSLISQYEVEGSATVQEGDILTRTHGNIHLPADSSTVQCT